MSEAVKASGDDAAMKRKFADLFQRLDGVATIDGRSFEAVLMDPEMDDEGGGMRAGGGGGGEGTRKAPRSPLQTIRVKGRLGSTPKREKESREREQLDLLEDIEANKANTEPR